MFKGKTLYFEEISPEKKIKNKKTIRQYFDEKHCWWQ